MSLRDLGVFNPLGHDHPLADSDLSCWKCGQAFGPGTRVGLNPIETPDEAGSLNVEAKAVCATCHLKGNEIETPNGRRIVDMVKDGDASPYPVVTTDGRQWKDEEVGP